MTDRYAHLRTVLGSELFEKVRSSKVLVVGAGGIGCELLKNLVLSGFSDIEVIDLDTIDLSNLNRQFLFHRKHIGQSKAHVARQSVLDNFDPSANIVAHHANVKSHEYGTEFFRKFDLVLNALDNLDARRHVNRLCVATDRPLIESGTAGYLGQVQVIVKGKTECYECQPKPAPKTYAYCTIRSSPKEPVHCVVWAKEEFATNFGDPSAVVPEDDELNDDEIKREEERLERIKEEKGYGPYLFHKLFFLPIFKKVRVAALTGKDVFMGRPPPTPLLLEDALAAAADEKQEVPPGQLPEQVLLSVSQTARVFLDSAAALRARVDATGFVEFEKDDAQIMGFVAAASNLRMHIFGIQRQSRFNLKSLAGNIIPAIATTNAVIAGLIVMEALKVLRSQIDQCRSIYVQKFPTRGRLLLSSLPDKPSPGCYVCSPKNDVTVRVNTETTTLGTFVELVLRKALSFNEPMVSIGATEIYISGEGLDEEEVERNNEQAKKLLKDVRIVHDVVAEVDDLSQELKVHVRIEQAVFGEEDQPFEIVGTSSIAKPAAPAPAAAAAPSGEAGGESAAAAAAADVVEVVEQAGPPPARKAPKAPEAMVVEPSAGKGKRKAEDELEASAETKRSRPVANGPADGNGRSD